MATYIIENKGGQYLLKRDITSKGEPITNEVAKILFAKYKEVEDGCAISLYVDKTYRRHTDFRYNSDASRLADRMAAIVKEEKGIDNIFGRKSSDGRAIFRYMIAYRLRLLGFKWAEIASAVGCTIALSQRIKPETFISDNPDSLWAKFLQVK